MTIRLKQSVEKMSNYLIFLQKTGMMRAGGSII